MEEQIMDILGHYRRDGRTVLYEKDISIQDAIEIARERLRKDNKKKMVLLVRTDKTRQFIDVTLTQVKYYKEVQILRLSNTKRVVIIMGFNFSEYITDYLNNIPRPNGNYAIAEPKVCALCGQTNVEYLDNWRLEDIQTIVNTNQQFKYKAQYYNRTWESYRYQSVMKCVVYDAIEYVTKKLTDKFKAENDIKRLTKARRGDLEVVLKNKLAGIQ